MTGLVTHVFTAPAAGEPMQSNDAVLATAGEGLAGDRYAKSNAAGRYSDRVGGDRHVTLITQESLDAASAELAEPIEPHQTRRNIVVTGVDLDALIGQRFRIGDAECRALRTCPPCTYLDALLGRRVLDALRDRGGIRAEILSSGTIRVGDALTPMGE